MKIEMMVDYGTETKGELTNEHCSSRYGFPVLVVESVAYGPADYVVYDRTAKGCSSMSSFDVIMNWLHENEGKNTLEQKEFCRRFISQFPEAPQIKIESDGSIKEFPCMERFEKVVTDIIDEIYSKRN